MGDGVEQGRLGGLAAAGDLRAGRLLRESVPLQGLTDLVRRGRQQPGVATTGRPVDTPPDDPQRAERNPARGDRAPKRDAARITRRGRGRSRVVDPHPGDGVVVRVPLQQLIGRGSERARGGIAVGRDALLAEVRPEPDPGARRLYLGGDDPDEGRQRGPGRRRRRELPAHPVLGPRLPLPEQRRLRPGPLHPGQLPHHDPQRQQQEQVQQLLGVRDEEGARRRDEQEVIQQERPERGGNGCRRAEHDGHRDHGEQVGRRGVRDAQGTLEGSHGQGGQDERREHDRQDRAHPAQGRQAGPLHRLMVVARRPRAADSGRAVSGPRPRARPRARLPAGAGRAATGGACEAGSGWESLPPARRRR